ncbi:MAG: F0F1 ATP synthase subunit B [Actinobacteria bacterium]|nr:F0F1 ATP synthase subunit B [Actinomycetota bacterium]NCG36760.1 F0F1 ATP synthase subunit B [Actinomycetota bacterium]
MTHTIRRIAGVLGIATAALAMMASPAGASGETIGSCAIDEAIEAEERLAADGIAFHSIHDEELETEFAELEKAMEGCLEAPSPIIPELDEIIWGGGAFLVLFGFMVWKGFPAVQGAMDARADKIAADLDAADQAMADAAKIKSDHAAELAGAKAEASELIEQARGQADLLRADLQSRAEADVAEMRTRAQADIDSSRAQAITDLRSEVSEIAVGAAEAVIKANLDRNAQSALVDAYIDEVAGRG